MKDSTMPHAILPLMLKLKTLREIGYDHDFTITPQGLQENTSGKIYKPEDIKIMSHFRDEGISNPDDMSILYTIVGKDGIKGTIVDAFGVYANASLMDFMKQVKDCSSYNL